VSTSCVTSHFLLTREKDCFVTGLHFTVLPVVTHRSARGQALLTAGPYIMHHGQREHLRNNRYQLSRIDSHVAPWGDHSLSPNWIQATSQMIRGIPSTYPVGLRLKDCRSAQLMLPGTALHYPCKQSDVEQGLRKWQVQMLDFATSRMWLDFV
jgi:hypothetical protein